MLLVHLHEPGDLAVTLTWCVHLARARGVPLALSVRGAAKGESLLGSFPPADGGEGARAGDAGEGSASRSGKGGEPSDGPKGEKGSNEKGSNGKGGAPEGGWDVEVRKLAAPLRVALDELLGPEGWTGDPPPEPDEDGEDSDSDAREDAPEARAAGPTPARESRAGKDDTAKDDATVGESADADAEPEVPPLEVRLAVVRGGDEARALVRLCEAEKPEAVVLVHVAIEGGNGASTRLRRHLFRDAPCEAIWLRPGEAVPELPAAALVGMARGPHARAALQLVEQLRASGAVSRTTALRVEPDLGSVTEGVGQRSLTRQLGRAAKDREAADAIEARVVVDEHEANGIRRAAEEREVPLVVLGASKQSALGRRLGGTVALKLLRGLTAPTGMVVRDALPLQGRAWRRIETALQRVVPQLEREQRIDLVERVQSNSHWDFDFVTLMSLSTAIAAFGLMSDAAAVIIGAMLVAPLMTPLLGVGLALVQGNPRLVRSALRSVSLGFVNAFVVGWLLGLLDPNFVAPTSEMLARGSPGFRDLAVAFVSGLAGAYASSRPSLMAALPGVAIAAALVPPIATSGLALSLGDWGLAGGALLLFGINAVLIVGASTVTLAVVGVRFEAGRSRVSQSAGWALVGASLVLTVLVAMRDTMPIVRAEGRAALERSLPEHYRVISVQWAQDAELGRVLRARVAGPRVPQEDLAQNLRAAWQEYEGVDPEHLPPLQLEFILTHTAR